ncbi:hypothetical protein YSA_08974 [Pseudomonas putida ND6]|uniref:Uncharacterized protein n=1 Tax=Pseudomonas putida ND6 TaxID=231023 RepID=I3V1J7_PSEPU|nr:hypothetical protein YSA_08974 [Pseudomonas putida ND6]
MDRGCIRNWHFLSPGGRLCGCFKASSFRRAGHAAHSTRRAWTAPEDPECSCGATTRTAGGHGRASRTGP